MTKLRKLLELSWHERVLLFRAAIFLVAAEIGLRVFAFRTLVERVQRTRGRTAATSLLSPERIAWLVEAAARNSWWRPTCLRQSLVLCALLRERGLPARMVIGATSPREGFQAHAWVVLGGKTLGSRDTASFQELACFDHLSARAEIA